MTSQFTTRFGAMAACALVGAGTAGSAMAQSMTPAEAFLNQSFVISGGAFILQTDLKANLNGQSANNPEVDFDNTFGKGKDSTRIRGDALWRITPKHHLTFMYFNNSTDRSKVLDKDFVWGDYTFKANGLVDSKQSYKVGALSYEYAFMHEPSYEVSANIGVHYTKMDLALSGSATITDSNGNVVTVPKASQQNSVPVPLPVIGLRGSWAVAPTVVLDASGQFFGVNYQGINGRWSDLRANATWLFNKNFGLGLGYDRFANRIDVSKDAFDGNVKLGYSGLQLFLVGAF